MPEGLFKRERVEWTVAGVLAVALVVFVHKATLVRAHASSDVDELPTIARVRDLIVEDWVEDPGPRRERLRYGAVEGMAAQLDPYSVFIPPESKEKFDEETNGEFGGLGVLIQIEGGQVVIVAPYEDTPAWEAGILPGDRVLEIDHKPYHFQNQDEATKRLRGPKGTTVDLLVSNPGKRASPVLLTLRRAVIKVQSVKGARVLAPSELVDAPATEAAPRIGYVRITQFQEPTLDEFDRAVATITSGGPLQALVLDLRGNPGGYLNKATEIASRFLDRDKVVVITRGRAGKNPTSTLANAPETAPRLRLPVAVLVDSGSASASEILAGCLQDHKVATLVGARSFGKGSVQSLLPIDDEKAKLKLTTHYYFTPNGRRIHRVEGATDEDRWGLLPDIPVPLDARVHQELLKQEGEIELAALKSKRDPGAPPTERPRLLRDPQLDAAVDHLRRVLKGEARIGAQPRTTPPDGVATVQSSGGAGRRPRPPEKTPEPGGG